MTICECGHDNLAHQILCLPHFEETGRLKGPCVKSDCKCKAFKKKVCNLCGGNGPDGNTPHTIPN